jgi:hypothetical protein
MKTGEYILNNPCSIFTTSLVSVSRQPCVTWVVYERKYLAVIRGKSIHTPVVYRKMQDAKKQHARRLGAESRFIIYQPLQRNGNSDDNLFNAHFLPAVPALTCAF